MPVMEMTTATTFPTPMIVLPPIRISARVAQRFAMGRIMTAMVRSMRGFAKTETHARSTHVTLRAFVGISLLKVLAKMEISVPREKIVVRGFVQEARQLIVTMERVVPQTHALRR